MKWGGILEKIYHTISAAIRMTKIFEWIDSEGNIVTCWEEIDEPPERDRMIEPNPIAARILRGDAATNADSFYLSDFAQNR